MLRRRGSSTTAARAADRTAAWPADACLAGPPPPVPDHSSPLHRISTAPACATLSLRSPRSSAPGFRLATPGVLASAAGSPQEGLGSHASRRRASTAPAGSAQGPSVARFSTTGALTLRVVATGDWDRPQEIVEAWRLEGEAAPQQGNCLGECLKSQVGHRLAMHRHEQNGTDWPGCT